MVRNLEDTAARHPDFQSMETIGGTSYPVTILSYQRFKFALYMISARVMGEIYSSSPTKSLHSVTKTVQSIGEDLKTWFDSLPPELRHIDPDQQGSTTREGVGRDASAERIAKIFRLQGLALQLAYDNVQILLHRPLLQLPNSAHNLSSMGQSTYNSEQLSSNGKDEGLPDEPGVDPAILAMSRTQCWESAKRTSSINLSIVKEASYTHAASYIGIQLFTAGVVLSIVALAAPLSPEAHQAKRYIGRIVSTSTSIGKKTLLSAQSQHIMRELVRLMLEKEMNTIFMEPDDGPSQNSARPPVLTPSHSATKAIFLPVQHGPTHLTQITEDTYVSNDDGTWNDRRDAFLETPQAEFAHDARECLPFTSAFDYSRTTSPIRHGTCNSLRWPLFASFRLTSQQHSHK